MTDWLPELIHFHDHGKDWATYEAALYEAFKDDFVHAKPVYRGTALSMKRIPISKGKEATFWHIISDGADEANRLINFRRCERIRWARALVENSEKPEVKMWVAEKSHENRIHLWLEEDDFVVVIADRGTYLLFWTAYHVDRDHQRRKLLREYTEYQAKQKKQAP
ncbi:hypothetical protein GHT07_15395 [Caenimonas koreensis DSM 17982]|uniref:Phage P1-related protein n=1 Tax=Caenimonas koreensis DSM 17982 TaxID=1121255 RepID=A0A844B643_9BURK|nr:hypothetical protein [Caenimonas koreensis]MRD48673.1 hypothetical protein [Caenimonas koreensis DSM 17982]